MGRVEPVERPLLEFGAAAPLAAVEPDQPERQRCHRLEEGEHRARDALRSFVLPGHVEGEDEGQPQHVVVTMEQRRREEAGCRPEDAFQRRHPLRRLVCIQSLHGQQPQQEGEIDILMPPVDAREEGPVEGPLADECEAQHPQGVFFEIVGVEKALHQQKAVDRKRQPTRQPQNAVKLNIPRPERSLLEQAVLEQGRADVVQQHRQAGNAFQGRAAEGKARAGKGVVLHFVRPHI